MRPSRKYLNTALSWSEAMVLSEGIDASLSYTELHFYCCVNDTEGKMTNNRQGHSLGVVCRILAKNAKVRSNGIKRGLSNEFRDEK